LISIKEKKLFFKIPRHLALVLPHLKAVQNVNLAFLLAKVF